MDEKQLPSDRWVHRRRMTYTALAGLFGLAVGAFSVEISTTQASLLGSIAYVLGSIVAAYVGVKTIAERLGKRDA